MPDVPFAEGNLNFDEVVGMLANFADNANPDGYIFNTLTCLKREKPRLAIIEDVGWFRSEARDLTILADEGVLMVDSTGEIDFQKLETLLNKED
jgi:hypothetical protein